MSFFTYVFKSKPDNKPRKEKKNRLFMSPYKRQIEPPWTNYIKPDQNVQQRALG